VVEQKQPQLKPAVQQLAIEEPRTQPPEPTPPPPPAPLPDAAGVLLSLQAPVSPDIAVKLTKLGLGERGQLT
jgi:hypothetical protein